MRGRGEKKGKWGCVFANARVQAANVSRLTGRAVKLDSLGGDDALPYTDGIRQYVVGNIRAAAKK